MTHPFAPLGDLGWDAAWREAASAHADKAKPGRVIRVDRGVCTVLTSHGPARATLGAGVLDTMAGEPSEAPCTGDWVLLRHWSDGPVTIETVLPRRSAVTRADAAGTSRGQVLAANIDVAAVVVGLVPDPNLRRVERLVTLAWQSRAEPLVVLTKADAVGDAESVAADVRSIAPDVGVVVCSTVSGVGIDELRALVQPNRTLGLLGASGHGKSSLTNALVGAESLSVQPIRVDGKGRHTTVRRELVLLPGGGCVIDTPGLRQVGLQSEEGLAASFPEIEELAMGCRFRDCRHESEPGCAVLAAVESGALHQRRLDSWRALQREMASMAARKDARLRAAELAQRKKQTQFHRNHKKGDP